MIFTKFQLHRAMRKLLGVTEECTLIMMTITTWENKCLIPVIHHMISGIQLLLLQHKTWQEPRKMLRHMDGLKVSQMPISPRINNFLQIHT